MRTERVVEAGAETPVSPEILAPKVPFDIDEAMARIAAAVIPFPKAALFELAEEGYTTPFEQLVACMISIRTRDEVTLPTARRLFEAARTPEAMLRLTPAEIDRRIRSCTFHGAKAAQIHRIAGRAMGEFSGALPCDEEV